MSITERKIIWMLLKRNTRFWICLAITLFVIMLALVGPVLTPYTPSTVVRKTYYITADELDAFINRTRAEGLPYSINATTWREKEYTVSRAYETSFYYWLRGYYGLSGLDIISKSIEGDTVRVRVKVPGDAYVTVTMKSRPPSPEFWFGTDKSANDVFAAVTYGLRVSLSIGVIAAIIATIIGTVLGLVAGYIGGLVDTVIDSATNFLLSLPTIFIMLIIGAYYIVGEQAATRNELLSIFLVGLLIGVLSWHWTARAVRAQVSALKASDFIAISRLSGNTTMKIILKDIIPNIASYILLVFVIQLANALGTTVTLEFLGIKASEWSLFARFNIWLIQGVLWGGEWWTIVIPGVVVVMMIASLYIIVLSLEEVFNPRLRRA